jgi:hypothetical protein
MRSFADLGLAMFASGGILLPELYKNREHSQEWLCCPVCKIFC